MAMIEVRVTRLDDRVSAVEREVVELDREVNTGDGDRRSLRYRVHQLEQFNAAAKAADAARDALRTAQSATRSARERKLTLAVAALNVLIVAAGLIVNALVVHG